MNNTTTHPETPTDFLLASYDYHLPDELIAQTPADKRSHSRLLVAQSEQAVVHSMFSQINDFLPPQTTLVFNRSKVFPCRLKAQRPSGGEAEVFFLSLIANGQGDYQAMLKASGKRKLGESFLAPGNKVFTITEVPEDGTFWLNCSMNPMELEQYLALHGVIPLPPYIRDGVAGESDKERYQTVYAKESGSVAAPTAGLHFTDELLAELVKAGHRLAFVTLHVGAGTFKPVKTDDIRDHHMHHEMFSVDEENARIIRESKGHIIAVGTTSLRVLESCWKEDDFDFPINTWRSTDIFLHPGKTIHSVRGMITNFHLPKSSLLMLVSTMMGRERMLAIYREAVEERYRFFSYGDSMLLLP